MQCPCGEKMEGTNANPYSYVRYDENSQIIYAICFHGHIVINKTGKWKDDFKGIDLK